MGVEIITKDDLESFRLLLIEDLAKLIAVNKKPHLQDWLKSNEVTKMLKISSAKLQNLRVSRKVHGVKIEGTWYYSLKSIEGLFEISED